EGPGEPGPSVIRVGGSLLAVVAAGAAVGHVPDRRIGRRVLRLARGLGAAAAPLVEVLAELLPALLAPRLVVAVQVAHLALAPVQIVRLEFGPLALAFPDLRARRVAARNLGRPAAVGVRVAGAVPVVGELAVATLDPVMLLRLVVAALIHHAALAHRLMAVAAGGVMPVAVRLVPGPVVRTLAVRPLAIGSAAVATRVVLAPFAGPEAALGRAGALLVALVAPVAPAVGAVRLAPAARFVARAVVARQVVVLAAGGVAGIVVMSRSHGRGRRLNGWGRGTGGPRPLFPPSRRRSCRRRLGRVAPAP